MIDEIRLDNHQQTAWSDNARYAAVDTLSLLHGKRSSLSHNLAANSLVFVASSVLCGFRANVMSFGAVAEQNAAAVADAMSNCVSMLRAVGFRVASVSFDCLSSQVQLLKMRSLASTTTEAVAVAPDTPVPAGLEDR